MKTLAEYLAEYIEQEMTGTMLRGSQGIDRITEIIRQGLEAYQSTENCTITVTKNGPEFACDDCKKCGESVCGNDPLFRCFEPKI